MAQEDAKKALTDAVKKLGSILNPTKEGTKDEKEKQNPTTKATPNPKSPSG